MLFWFAIAVAMLLLGVNKQFDIQSLFTEIARFYAHRDGWYQHRRTIQVTGISIVVGFFVFTLKRKDKFKDNRLVILEVVFLLSFVVIRVISYHYVDILISMSFMGIKINWILELSGILVILFSTLLKLNKQIYS